MSVYAFAKKIGIPQPTVQGWLNEGRDPRLSQVEKIMLVFTEINGTWLTTGKGEMFNPAEYLKSLEREIGMVNEQLALYRKVDSLREENESLKKVGTNKKKS